MIKSPYDALGAPREVSPEQEVEGEFQCEVCYTLSDRATYLPEFKLLSWKCYNHHTNRIEEYELV